MNLDSYESNKEIDNLFDLYMRAIKQYQIGSQDINTKSDWASLIEIAETENTFVIKAAISEVKKEDIKITVDNGILKIMGERKQPIVDNNKKYNLGEFSMDTFTRSFALPENLDKNNINASFKNGILNLYIQKIKVIENQVIEVKIA